MKNYIYLFIIVLLIGCKKDDKHDDPYYTDFHDTLLEPNGINVPTNFNFDMDKDAKIDISIEIKDGYSFYGSFDSYIQIDTKNNWEILFSNIIDTAYEWAPSTPDTIYYYYSVLMPRINNNIVNT